MSHPITKKFSELPKTVYAVVAVVYGRISQYNTYPTKSAALVHKKCYEGSNLYDPEIETLTIEKMTSRQLEYASDKNKSVVWWTSGKKDERGNPLGDRLR